MQLLQPYGLLISQYIFRYVHKTFHLRYELFLSEEALKVGGVSKRAPTRRKFIYVSMLQKLEIFSASTHESVSVPVFFMLVLSLGNGHNSYFKFILLTFNSFIIFFRRSVLINNISSLLSSPTLNFSPID